MRELWELVTGQCRWQTLTLSWYCKTSELNPHQLRSLNFEQILSSQSKPERVTFEEKASGVSLVWHKLKKSTAEFLNQSSTDRSLGRSEGSGWKSLCVNNKGVWGNITQFTMNYASYYINSLVSSSAPPYATILMDETVVRPGDALRLQCLAHGTHPIRFRWMRVGGASMSPGAESTKDGLLKIPRLKASDSGTYKCVATNHVGSSEALTKVIVRGAWNSEKTFRICSS